MLQPVRAYFLRRSARAASKSHRWSDAIAHYEALRRAGAARPSDVVRHAQSLEAAGRKDAAEETFRDNVALFPLEANVSRQFALFLLRTQQPGAAALAFARAWALAPEDRVLSTDLEALGVDGAAFFALAAAGFHAAPTPGPRRPGPVKRFIARRAAQRAKALRQSGDWMGALAAQTAVLANNPGNASAHVRHGHVLRALGRLEEAERAYWRGVALAPRDADHYLQLGHGLKQTRGLRTAFPAYLLARRLKPSLVEAGAAVKELGVSDSDAASFADALGEANLDRILAAARAMTSLAGSDGAPPSRAKALERARSAFIDVRAAAIAGDIGRSVGVSL